MLRNLSIHHKKLVPVLAYHEVADKIEKYKKIRSMQPSFCIDAKKFDAQMAYLYHNNYKVNIIDQLNSFVSDIDNYPHKRQVVITFDDGHCGNYQFAYPILMKYGHRATFFVTINFIGQQNMMTWKQLCEMSDNGMSIQSHAMTHEPLETLNRSEIIYELKNSKEIIQNRLNKNVSSVSLPHGSIKSDIIDIARKVGYEYIYISKINYYINTLTENNIIPRIPIHASYSVNDFVKVVDGDKKLIQRLQISQNIKLGLKRIVGINNYRKVYRFLFRIEKNK